MNHTNTKPTLGQGCRDSTVESTPRLSKVNAWSDYDPTSEKEYLELVHAALRCEARDAENEIAQLMDALERYEDESTPHYYALAWY